MFDNSRYPDSSDDEMNDYEDSMMDCEKFICFKCNLNFDVVDEMFNHVLEEHNINIKGILSTVNIQDEYDWIKLINYLRKNISCLNIEDIKNENWKDDIYLQPVLENDTLLFFDFCNIKSNSGNEVSYLKDQIIAQETTISLLRNKISNLLDNQFENVENNQISTLNHGSLTSEDKTYFTGYSHYSIHDIMIKDKVRTNSYQNFIEKNGSKFFKDKIILDVGCGTGILSIFAARAGAKHVYAVDCADIIYDAMAIVEKNGLKDKITLIHGKLEEIGLPCDKVDVIISEWMGYFLIYESMLDSVLFACRKYLKVDTGLVFPQYFSLNVLGASLATYRRDNFDCWDSVHGIDMSCMKMNILKETIVDTVPLEDIITSSCLLREYDVQKIAFEDSSISTQKIDANFHLVVTHDDTLGAIVTFFDTYFINPCAGQVPEQIMFSTSPQSTPTHWQQVVLLLEKPIEVKQGQRISGMLNIDRYKQGQRGLDIYLTLEGLHPQRFEFP